MIAQQHSELSDKIWSVANKLRGPYRPPQYRRVMLPMIVLRRLDCVLEPTKDKVLKQYDALKKKKRNCVASAPNLHNHLQQLDFFAWRHGHTKQV